jgi:ABC-type uncharacterized transport system permease subunit
MYDRPNISLSSKNEIQTTVLEKSKHTFYVQYLFIFEVRVVYEIMRKNTVRARRATDDNMAHAHSLLDT